MINRRFDGKRAMKNPVCMSQERGFDLQGVNG